ncbi:MAG: hypothetical protein KAH06_10335 [Desulfobacterales bacterium]|nr:hypothetical protein [Desulfobacterales bacterium]
MKNKPTDKKNNAVFESGDKVFPPQSEKPGVLKRFLNWIAKGAEKVCPT